MRKVTKLLLVASVAGLGAIGFNACGDSITVVEPAPPPPPPPPPVDPPVNAEITIQGFRELDGDIVDPDDVDGEIVVIYNVTSGDFNIAQIDILFDGTPIGCQTITGSVGDTETANATDVVECYLKTDAAARECDGTQLNGQYANGEHVIGGRLTTTEGTSTDAANAATLNFDNTNYVWVVADLGAGVINQEEGVRFHGGPTEAVSFWACAVVFDDDITVGAISLAGEEFDGAADANLGEGYGVLAMDDEAPWMWTLDPTDDPDTGNLGVEDDPDPDDGHGIGWFFGDWDVHDTDGVNIKARFTWDGIGPREVWLDFTPPAYDFGGASEVQLDAMDVMADEYYSAGDFSISFVEDFGVGYQFGVGAQIDVIECGDDHDDDPFAPDQVDLEGHPEDDPLIDADANELDCYEALVRELADDLGNANDPDDLEADIPISANYGVDRTAPELSDRLPEETGLVINPDVTNDGVCAAGECIFSFTAEDPDLESGDAGSQVDLTGLPGAAGEVEAISTDEDDNDANHFVTEVAAGDFEVNIEPAGLGTGLPPDGTYDIEVIVPDNAVLDPNVATTEFTVILDNTAPIFGALNPAPTGSPGTDASAIVLTIGGTIDDANVLDLADLTVTVNGTDAAGTAPTLGGCAAAVAAANLYTLSVTGGEIDRNAIDLTNGTNEIDFTGAAVESFTVAEPAGAVNPVQYCFVIDAEDEALDIDGTAAPNVSQLVTQVDVTWNP